MTQLSSVMDALYPNKECEEMLRLKIYETKVYKKFSSVILKDNGIPDLMRIVAELTQRMNNFKNGKSPRALSNASKNFMG